MDIVPLLVPANTALETGFTHVDQTQSLVSATVPNRTPSLFQRVNFLSLPPMVMYSPVGKKEMLQGSKPKSLSLPIYLYCLPPET